MKAGAVRKLAAEYDLKTLEAAATAVADAGEELLPCEGDDLGERLTHLLLAIRVRRRMDGGLELKEAFRLEMAAVRDVLKNE